MRTSSPTKPSMKSSSSKDRIYATDFPYPIPISPKTSYVECSPNSQNIGGECLDLVITLSTSQSPQTYNLKGKKKTKLYLDVKGYKIKLIQM